jgi:hypothetical protein
MSVHAHTHTFALPKLAHEPAAMVQGEQHLSNPLIEAILTQAESSKLDF